MSDSKVKIEIHLIQNFAPSNLNRDDTGQPKSAIFGGFRRARVSSQCGKRAARDWWREHGTVTVGDRTKKLQQLISDELAQDSEFMQKVADQELRAAGVSVFVDAYYAGEDKKKPKNTNVLIFIGPDEIEVCAQAIKELWDDNWDDKPTSTTKKGKQSTDTVDGIASIVKKLRAHHAKKASHRNDSDSDATADQVGDEEPAEDTNAKKKAKKPKLTAIQEIKNRISAAHVSADIALFGRMLAEQPERNTDGACQVAHPISTHRVDMEMDFFTAVDDLNLAEEPGAGMMGIVGYNSACYYRYALVDRDQLARNLARKTERKNGEWTQALEARDYQEADTVIKAFLEAMVYAIPTGKQNSFAAQNLPSFGLFVKRQGGVPVSLANAFAVPVRPTKDDDDLIGLSVDALTRHWNALVEVYGSKSIQKTACFHVGQSSRLNGLCGESNQKSVSAEEAINAIMEAAKGQ